MTHGFTSFTVVPAHKRKRWLQRKMELLFSQCSPPPTPEQTWSRHSCFLWSNTQHVIPVGKWRSFVITIVIPHFLGFLQHFTSFGDRLTHNLTLYNTLTKQTSQKPKVLPRHPNWPHLWLQLKKTAWQELVEKLRYYISATRWQQTAWQNSTKQYVTAPHSVKGTHCTRVYQCRTLHWHNFMEATSLHWVILTWRRLDLWWRVGFNLLKTQVQLWASKSVLHFMCHVFHFPAATEEHDFLLSSPDFTGDWRHLIHHTHREQQPQSNPQLCWNPSQL